MTRSQKYAFIWPFSHFFGYFKSNTCLNNTNTIIWWKCYTYFWHVRFMAYNPTPSLYSILSESFHGQKAKYFHAINIFVVTVSTRILTEPESPLFTFIGRLYQDRRRTAWRRRNSGSFSPGSSSLRRLGTRKPNIWPFYPALSIRTTGNGNQCRIRKHCRWHVVMLL